MVTNGNPCFRKLFAVAKASFRVTGSRGFACTMNTVLPLLCPRAIAGRGTVRQKFQTNEKPRPRLAAVNFLFKPSGHLRRRHRLDGAQQGRPQPAPARARRVTYPFSLWHGRPLGRLLRLQNKAGSALKSPGYFKTQEGCMPTGKVKMFNEQRGFGFIRPDDGGADIFFHVSALREGDEITEGNAVSFETGPDLKTGKIKAISVDLT